MGRGLVWLPCTIFTSCVLVSSTWDQARIKTRGLEIERQNDGADPGLRNMQVAAVTVTNAVPVEAAPSTHLLAQAQVHHQLHIRKQVQGLHWHGKRETINDN